MGEARIASGLAEVEEAPSVVSIGFFDGVHRGHQSIIGRAVRAAQERDLRSVVVTFDRHPMEVVKPGSQPRLLMTLQRRARTLSDQGVDLVVVLPFDDALRHLKPAEFVDRVLVDPLHARKVVVGANFRFGHRAAGDVALLNDLGPQRGFDVEGVSLLSLDGEPISSTAIRAAVDEGDVEKATRLLGRPHVLDGIVIRGDARGATLGFPTANLQVSDRLAIPARGIYAGCCHLEDDTLVPCVTSVGFNPTFGGQELRVESYLLDFDGDLYGRSIALDFRHRLRDEQRFDSADELIAAIHDDVKRARELLGA